jgi:hypothetical protein
MPLTRGEATGESTCDGNAARADLFSWIAYANLAQSSSTQLMREAGMPAACPGFPAVEACNNSELLPVMHPAIPFNYYGAVRSAT